MKDIEIVTELSTQMDMSPREVVDVLSALYLLIGNTISKGGSVTLVGVGQFEAKKKAERVSYNPINGQRNIAPSKLTPIFKPASSWKTYLKKMDENE